MISCRRKREYNRCPFQGTHIRAPLTCSITLNSLIAINSLCSLLVHTYFQNSKSKNFNYMCGTSWRRGTLGIKIEVVIENGFVYQICVILVIGEVGLAKNNTKYCI